jgi:serine/threonine-protein kinase
MLGVGGMGEVYLARDTRLGRQVALKVLPDAFLADGDRVARFEREAKILASLNHPNIASLHGLDSAEGRHLLVMELVTGDTVADRLVRGALPAADALIVARQVAEALEAAHEKGIVHRDLKPANIKITAEGMVKVLDFGLAKAVESSASSADVANSPTLSMMATQAGLILGTAAYMSPEQAKGLPADARSDVFSFGAVLFEMLTGRQPFGGETAPDIMASVLVREPDLTLLPANLGRRTVDLVRRCLEKSPKRRWQAIGDVRAEIETILDSPASSAEAPRGSAPVAGWRRALIMAASALAGAAIVAVGAWRLWPAMPSPAVSRFLVPLDQGQRLTSGGRRAFTLSPDGRILVFAANGRLFLRRLSEFDARPIAGLSDTDSPMNPVFSPDGRLIAYWSADRHFKQVPVEGGSPSTFGNVVESPLGTSWSEQGFLYGQANGIWRIRPSGGQAEHLVKTKEGEFFFGPQLLPDGRHIIFTVASGDSLEDWDRGVIVARALDTGGQVTLLEGGSDARYLTTGYLTYVRGGTLFAVRFDAERLRVIGTPLPAVEGVRRSVAGASGTGHYSVSPDGVLAYLAGLPGVGGGRVGLAIVDGKGVQQKVTALSGSFDHPRIAPDSRRVSFQISNGSDVAVWTQSLDRATSMTRLTFAGRNRFPIWSPDSQRVTFQSDRDGDAGIWWQGADASGAAERLTRADSATAHIPDDWSPDGKHLLVTVKSGPRYTLHVWSAADHQLRPLNGVDSLSPLSAVFSPDGRWIAYATARSNTNDTQLFVEPFPQSSAKYQLFAKSGDNPHHPIWSRDGRKLYYVPRVNGLEYVDFGVTPAVGFGSPVPVHRAFPLAAPTTPRTFDVAKDGRILSAVVVDESGKAVDFGDSFHVVLNWLEDVRGRMAGAR